MTLPDKPLANFFVQQEPGAAAQAAWPPNRSDYDPQTVAASVRQEPIYDPDVNQDGVISAEEQAAADAHIDKFPADHDYDPDVNQDGVISAEEQAAADAHAAHIAHPHTQLSAIMKDLQTPRLDMHDRIGTLQRNLVALAQVILQHTPAPEPRERTPDEEFQAEQRREREQFEAHMAEQARRRKEQAHVEG